MVVRTNYQTKPFDQSKGFEFCAVSQVVQNTPFKWGILLTVGDEHKLFSIHQIPRNEYTESQNKSTNNKEEFK